MQNIVLVDQLLFAESAFESLLLPIIKHKLRFLYMNQSQGTVKSLVLWLSSSDLPILNSVGLNQLETSIKAVT